VRVVFVGFDCNNACVFCAQGASRERSPRADLAEIEAELAAIQPGERVAFIGGEPTIFDELPEWVAAARARGASAIVVQTNGRRLSIAGYAEELVAAGVNALEVSLAGANEATHDYHTQVPGSFRQTVAGLRRARHAGLSFALNVVITRSNFRHLGEIARVAQALGARAVRFQTAERLGSARVNAPRVIAPRELVRPELGRALERGIALGIGVVVGERSEPASAAEGFAGIGRVETEDEPE
jgi:MoaA/NifB/PqqE/SkfB family radical SAM enzyme